MNNLLVPLTYASISYLYIVSAEQNKRLNLELKEMHQKIQEKNPDFKIE